MCYTGWVVDILIAYFKIKLIANKLTINRLQRNRLHEPIMISLRI